MLLILKLLSAEPLEKIGKDLVQEDQVEDLAEDLVIDEVVFETEASVKIAGDGEKRILTVVLKNEEVQELVTDLKDEGIQKVAVELRFAGDQMGAVDLKGEKAQKVVDLQRLLLETGDNLALR